MPQAPVFLSLFKRYPWGKCEEILALQAGWGRQPAAFFPVGRLDPRGGGTYQKNPHFEGFVAKNSTSKFVPTKLSHAYPPLRYLTRDPIPSVLGADQIDGWCAVRRGGGRGRGGSRRPPCQWRRKAPISEKIARRSYIQMFAFHSSIIPLFRTYS